MSEYVNMTELRERIAYIQNLICNTISDEKYVPNAEKWRNLGDSFSTYTHFIDCHEVFPGIFLGNMHSAEYKNFLMDIGVTHVLNCACQPGSKLNEDYYKSSNIKFKGLDLEDVCKENITRYFEEANYFIDDALKNNGKVLVHCLAGISRSATITIAYLMKVHQMTLEEAAITVKKARSIMPNEGFIRQLVEYDYQLKQERNITNDNLRKY